VPRGASGSQRGEIAVASKEELDAAPYSGKGLLTLWNALPGVEKRRKVGDREALIDELWAAIEALPDPEPGSLAEAGLAREQCGPGVVGFGLTGWRIEVQKWCTIPLGGWLQYPSPGATRHGLAGFALTFADDGKG
jgi:hypothetical protein